MYTPSKLLSMQYSMVTNRHSFFFFNVQIPLSEVPLHKTARSLSFPPPQFNWGIIDKAKMYVFKMHNVMIWYTYTLCYDYISKYIFLIKHYSMDSRSHMKDVFCDFFASFTLLMWNLYCQDSNYWLSMAIVMYLLVWAYFHIWTCT